MLQKNLYLEAEEKLKELKYNVKREGNAILAERGRFSRWGPYVNHLGLIIIPFWCNATCTSWFLCG